MSRALLGLGCVAMLLICIGGVFGARHVQSWTVSMVEYLWHGYTLPPNIERRRASIDGEAVSFLFVRIDDSLTWDFANAPSSPLSVHAWRELLDADVVVNGAYFTETNQPAGYYVIDGNANMVCPLASSDSDIVSGYTFAVWIHGGTLEFGSVAEHPEICGGPGAPPVTAFASFPTLVRQNAAMIEKDSELKAHRTMLAETMDGTRYIVLTESGEATLYDLAQWFLAQSEDYRIVGNLDGGPSTGISIRGTRWDVEVPSAAVPNVIWGTRK